MANTFLKHLFGLSAALYLSACDSRSFSVAPASEEFRQQASINNKVDIVWVVDGSLTMANHQANLAANFDNFIEQFGAKGFDYRMVITSTDAWMREANYNAGTCTANPNPTNNPLLPYISSADCQNTRATFNDLTAFRDGDIYGFANGNPGVRSGTYLISSTMDNTTLVNTFKTNVKVGTRGDGSKEAGLQSLRSVLRRNSDGSVGYGGETHTALSSFRRDDAFLAVIIVSDEEDQSTQQNGVPYADNDAYTQSFLEFMDGYTGSASGNRKYSVSGIFLEDINNCPYGLNPQASQGDRYKAIVEASRGTAGSICSADFSSQLNNISQKIITLATRFKLNREPKEETISVSVNGTPVAQDPVNGWSYFRGDDESHFIEFHGASVPPENALIGVNFDPKDLL